MTSLPVIRIIDPPSNNTNSRTFWPTPLLYNLFFFQRNRTRSNCHACKTILCETRTEQVTSIIDLYRRKVLSCFALEFGDSRFDCLSLVVAGDIFWCVFWFWRDEGAPSWNFLRVSLSFSLLFCLSDDSFLITGHGIKKLEDHWFWFFV